MHSITVVKANAALFESQTLNNRTVGSAYKCSYGHGRLINGSFQYTKQ